MQQIVDCTEEKAQVQSVLLLTDGLANEGIKSKDGILKEMNKLQSKTDKSKAYWLCVKLMLGNKGVAKNKVSYIYNACWNLVLCMLFWDNCYSV